MHRSTIVQFFEQSCNCEDLMSKHWQGFLTLLLQAGNMRTIDFRELACEMNTIQMPYGCHFVYSSAKIQDMPPY